jgi:hypothetical protein
LLLLHDAYLTLLLLLLQVAFGSGFKRAFKMKMELLQLLHVVFLIDCASAPAASGFFGSGFKRALPCID